jgi:putative transposase
MPWKATREMDQRIQFIADCLKQEVSMAELCRHYGISRKTGYKWLGRYEAGGPGALEECSRAPLTHPLAITSEMAEALLAARGEHPTWGPRKLLAWLGRRRPAQLWPAPSTVGDLLRRNGLVALRRPHRRAAPGAPLLVATQANQTWCADFKGWFRTGDGQRCDPLTVSDASTRYLLRCQAVPKTDGTHVGAIFEAAFREYGLPLRLRTDNGAPFASTGLGGLTSLAVWWIRLGIVLERIAPGHPEQNGCHERMHRTLKHETASPPKTSLRVQQRCFDAWRHQFNHERPHEALGQRPPGDLYEPSPRSYPRRLAEVDYPDDWDSRAVRGCGQMKWGGHDVQISTALVGERIGLEPVGDGVWRIHFFHQPLGYFDERTLTVRPLSRPPKRTQMVTLPP